MLKQLYCAEVADAYGLTYTAAHKCCEHLTEAETRTVYRCAILGETWPQTKAIRVARDYIAQRARRARQWRRLAGAGAHNIEEKHTLGYERRHLPLRVRAALKLTAEGLADLINTSPHTVRRWEAGTARPDPWKFQKLLGIWQAVEMFQERASPDQIIRWLQTPVPALGGRLPVNLLAGKLRDRDLCLMFSLIRL